MVKMKRLLFLLCFIFLCSCSAPYKSSFEEDRLFYVKRVSFKSNETNVDDGFMNAIWVSQFDMHPIYRDGDKQRDLNDYIRLVGIMTDNLVRDGFDTVFLQVRPNGDSMFESEIYPNSKYVAGCYGGDIEYDAVREFLNMTKSKGISVHAWINPFRLCSEGELLSYGDGILYDWYTEGVGNRIERAPDGLLYLDPAFEDATELICRGAEEILSKYDFDGLHIDDYFYPTEFEFDDEESFLKSGFVDLGDFRRSNVNRTVKALYEVADKHEKLFGVSPAGNIYSLENGWYVDIYSWLSSDGYVDYIMPQIYFGFKNAVCPFDTVLKDWANAVKNESIKLYIGLSGAKCALGSQSVADAFAGEDGRFEWRDEKDILARSYKLSLQSADGVCVFSYSSFYDTITGKDNPLCREEKENLISLFAQ